MKCASRKKSLVTRVVLTGAIATFLSFASQGVWANESSAARTEITMTLKDLQLNQMSSKIKGMVDVANHLAGLSLKCEAASDCVAIPMGDRACGGPNYYTFTSKLNPSLTAVMETAALVTKAEKEMNTNFSLFSICSVERPPDLTCVENTCGQP